MKVTITKELDESYGVDGLTDEAIIELLLEDVAELLNDATWKIEREQTSAQPLTRGEDAS